MSKIKQKFEFDPNTILEILTLRYAVTNNPPDIPKLTWDKFTENKKDNYEKR